MFIFGAYKTCSGLFFHSFIIFLGEVETQKLFITIPPLEYEIFSKLMLKRNYMLGVSNIYKMTANIS